MRHRQLFGSVHFRRNPRLGMETLEPRYVLSVSAVLPLKIAEMQSAGLASFSTSTPVDIGNVSQIFDGDTSTLMRTASVNPAVVDLSFTNAESLRSFRVYTSSPQHQWTIESAMSLSDLNGHTGTYADSVPWTMTSGNEYSTATLSSPVVAKYLRLTVQRLAGDNYVHLYEWEVTGDVVFNSIALAPASFSIKPSATKTLTPTFTTTENISYDFPATLTWGTNNSPVATVSSSGVVTGVAQGTATITASAGDLQGTSSVTVLAPEPTDLDVTYIGRTPRYNYDAAKNNPAPGDAVTFEAHVKNWGSQALSAVGYRWSIDGVVVSQGSIANFAGASESVLSLPWVWQAGAHDVKFTIDPQNAVVESSEANNSIDDRTDGISVGFWVEQSLYDYFQAHQRDLGVGSNSWEDWAQRQMAHWNQFAANAIYDSSPLGSVDRVRIDKITVVPDGALPLNGGLPTNDPDLSDKTVDMMWGFPTGDFLTSGFYANTTSTAETNPFYFEQSLVHELGHARYLIDVYSFDVHDTSSNTISVMEQGTRVAGSSLMPYLAFNEVLYYNQSGGIMGGPYESVWSPYEAGALNQIAGKRASQGNVNAPGNIGVFLKDLPDTNRVRFITESGAIAAGANVKLFQSVSNLGGYSKVIDNTADATYTTDANGEIVLPKNPFGSGGVSTVTPSNPPIVLLRVELAGKVWYQFLEGTQFNMEYWAGHTTEGQYVIELPGVGNTRVARDIALESENRPITRGSMAPSIANGTDFGGVQINKPSIARLFDVKNDGGATLTLTGSTRVTISGVNAADFSVTVQPSATVGAGGLSPFRLQFTPHGLGLRTAIVTIVSDDPDEGTFSFAVQGTGRQAGDYNSDGSVSGSDYSVWRQNFGKTVLAYSGADGNGNSHTDATDYVTWRNNLSTPAAAAAVDDFNRSGGDTANHPSGRNELGGNVGAADNGVWQAQFGQEVAGTSVPTEPGAIELASMDESHAAVVESSNPVVAESSGVRVFGGRSAATIASLSAQPSASRLVLTPSLVDVVTSSPAISLLDRTESRSNILDDDLKWHVSRYRHDDDASDDHDCGAVDEVFGEAEIFSTL